MLVVDDHEDNVELFATILRGAGFIVMTAMDGADALEVAARERPRVVVMDLGMPRMDGFEAITRLRREEHGRDVYVIVVSAFGDALSRARALHVGANDFLPKPCPPRSLLEKVHQAFDPPSGTTRAAAG